MICNAVFWAGYIRRGIIPEAEALGQVFEQKILPAFDGIKNEAVRVRDEVFGRASSGVDEDWDSADMMAEAADEAGFQHYCMLTDLKQGIINLFAAGVYHLFEQQLLLLYRNGVLSPTEKSDRIPLKREKMQERLRAQGIAIETFCACPKLEELRLVANVVKHAGGRSSTQLKQQRPDMFSYPHPAIRSVSAEVPPPSGGSFEPLFGEGFYVTPDDIRLYVKAVIEFWEEFASRLEGDPSGSDEASRAISGR